MPKTHRNPRTIAVNKNDAQNFATAEVEAYDAVAGTPPGVAPQGQPQDYRVDPHNPPEPPVPAKNLKGS